MGFINRTCVRADYVGSNFLTDQWDRCNVVVLSWIFGSLSEDVYLGHVFFNNVVVVWNELKDTYNRVDGSIMQFFMDLDDIYQPIRSSILTKVIIPEVKDAFVIIAGEESHRGISPTSVKSEKPQASAFVFRFNDNIR
ncbi:hypothetical protein Tco_0425718 [Tanacetum coccineum]